MTKPTEKLFSIPEYFEGDTNLEFMSYIVNKANVYKTLNNQILKTNPDSYHNFVEDIKQWIDNIKLKGDECRISWKK